MNRLNHRSFFTSDKTNLWYLLLTGLAVRLIGIGYGLPSTYNSTEYFIAKQALSFGARHTLEPIYFIYPTLYAYLIAGLYALYYLLGSAVGVFHAPADFALQFFKNPTGFYLSGRLLNAAAFLAAVGLFYRTARLFLPPRRAFPLSFLFLFSGIFYQYSFWMVPDAFLILGSMASFYFMARLYVAGISRRLIFWGSLFAGLTISVKYNAGFLALAWPAAIWLWDKSDTRSRVKMIAFSLMIILLGFLVGTPYWILEFPKFWEGFRTVWSQSRYDYNFTTGLPYVWEAKTILQTDALLGLLFLVTLVLAALRPSRFRAPFLLVILPTFLMVGSWQKKGLDYMLIIFPALLLLFAEWWAKKTSPPWRRLIPWFLAAALLVNIPRIFYTDYRRLQTDTRQQAGHWIMSHLPPGTRICYDHYHYDIDLIDVERFQTYGQGSRYLPDRVRTRLAELRQLPNNYRLISPLGEEERPGDARHLASSVRRDPFLLSVLRHPHKSLDELLREKVRYLIVNSETYLKYLKNPLPPPENPLRGEFERRRNFYRRLFREFTPVQVFRPDGRHPGPEIQIYRLD